MIKEIKLVNFSTFCNLEANFQVKGKLLPLAFIYGENGSGKSSLVSSISFLMSTMDSMLFAERFKSFFDKIATLDKKEEMFSTFINEFLHSHDLEILIDKYKTIGSKDNMVLDYTFIIDDNEYNYKMIFDSFRIISEQLYGKLSKNRTLIYSVNLENDVPRLKTNGSLFINKQFQNEINSLTSQYFGKHTFLSILNKEIDARNNEFVISSLNSQMLAFMDSVDDIAILSDDELYGSTTFASGRSIVRDLHGGQIEVDQLDRLEYSEKIVNDFFSSLFSDITGAFYTKETKDDKVNYKLFFKKRIGNITRDIPFDRESNGTKKLLKLIPFFAGIVNKKVVIIDELDTGIHDLLMIALVNKIKSSESLGQLIVTTHNTLLLNELSKDEVFILETDTFAKRSLTNLSDFGIPIQKNHSMLLRYLRGDFGGIPVPGYFDLNYLFNENGKKA